MGQDFAQSDSSPASDHLYRLLTDPASHYLVVHGLVILILSYELCFSGETVTSRVMSNGLVMGLWLTTFVIAMLP